MEKATCKGGGRRAQGLPLHVFWERRGRRRGLGAGASGYRRGRLYLGLGESGTVADG